MDLNSMLANFKQERLKEIPDEIKLIMKKATDDLLAFKIEEKLPKVGSKAIDFTLKNHLGKEFKLSEAVKNRFVILTFYRGGWCPYCNLQLNYLNSRLDEFNSVNADLVAVSPELPDFADKTIDRHGLKFQVLSDVGNKVAKKYNLVFKLPDELVALYLKLGHNLSAYNGNENAEIPVPATFVINSDMRISYSFGKADYTVRAEPDEIIEAIKRETV